MLRQPRTNIEIIFDRWRADGGWASLMRRAILYAVAGAVAGFMCLRAC